MTKPILNIFAGSVLGLMGLIALVTGVYYGIANKDVLLDYLGEDIPNSEADYFERDQFAFCQSTMEELGFDANDGGGEVIGTLQDFPEPETGIYMATAAIYACFPMEMERFCIGVDCDHPVEISFR